MTDSQNNINRDRQQIGLNPQYFLYEGDVSEITLTLSDRFRIRLSRSLKLVAGSFGSLAADQWQSMNNRFHYKNQQFTGQRQLTLPSRFRPLANPFRCP